MADVQLKIADKVYDVPTATLGELRQIKQHFGVTVREFADNPIDPDVIAAMAWLAIKRVNPSITVDDIDAIESVELIDVEEAEQSPPDDGADVADEAAPEQTDSSPETIPEDSGDPSTPASTASQPRIA